MRTSRWLVPAWAIALAVLVLGPALGPGYLLTYDMVWVPDLALRSDFLGLGSALPRAVPSDAVVAVLDEVLPGMLLQKVVLVGALVAGGLGAARLAGRSPVARLVAVGGYAWSPYVVERLWIGHWPLLLCWAVLPWLVAEGIRLRADPRIGAAVPFLLLAGSLSANAGLMAAATLLAVGATRATAARLLALVVAANAPWVVAGLLHIDTATSSAAGAVFGLDAEGPLPAPLAALTLGGIWNAEVVPPSRELLVLPLVLTLSYAALAAVGARPLARRLGRRVMIALVALWAVGYVVAVLSWASPDAVGWLAGHVPGGGLLRDGTRSLALGAPLTATLVAAGVQSCAEWCAHRAAQLAVLAAGALLPLALMPDAAWGIGGRLEPADYPAPWAAARATLGDGRADLLVLPFTSYRAPVWNHDGKVLDPLPRYLRPDYIVNDQLAVDGRVIAGEDPRVPDVLAALALPDADDRADALAQLGIGAVVRDRTVPTTPAYDAAVGGTVVFDDGGLEVTVLDASIHEREAPSGWLVALGLAWAAFLGVAVHGMWNGWRAISSRMRTGPGSG
ncbi:MULTISPECIES: hypothetical protein [unclassified Nocardioides]|uniref:hypothetical protein n=1 Tax=unclassified Nocardioides TaxID=2615069 RepID=UPI00111E34AA|nr:MULTISPECIES: hypothetical protein [unclassified Nocardioides]